MLHLLESAGLSLTIATCCLGCSTTALEMDSTIKSRLSTDVYSVYCRSTVTWIQQVFILSQLYSTIFYQHTNVNSCKFPCLHDRSLVFRIEEIGNLRHTESMVTKLYCALETEMGIQQHTNVPPTFDPRNDSNMHSFRLFFASSVCTLLLSAEETTTSVIKAISVMNVLKSLVASSLKLLNFFDTSGDISSVFFNAEAQRSHCTNNVTLLQLCRVGLNQPTTRSTGHRHGGDS